ncbi:hypothetical protein SAMN02746064_01319, partial [Alkalibacter saccharofermentans DSM 14828]
MWRVILIDYDSFAFVSVFVVFDIVIYELVIACCFSSINCYLRDNIILGGIKTKTFIFSMCYKKFFDIISNVKEKERRGDQIKQNKIIFYVLLLLVSTVFYAVHADGVGAQGLTPRTMIDAPVNNQSINNQDVLVRGWALNGSGV